jgi:hypothetical protein
VGGYGHHPQFSRPPADAQIWRYLDLAKLLDMLDRASLHFARADSMADPWEAVMPQRSVDAYMKRVHEQAGVGGDIEALKSSYIRFQREMRERVFMSCWYVAEHESAAMWDLYGGREGRGIAIQSTFGRLEQSLPRDCPWALYAGLVRYIDFGNDVIEGGNAFEPVLHKRLSYEHERELRVVLDVHEAGRPETGLAVAVDIPTLIESLRISPLGPEWFTALLQRTIGRYGLEVPVQQSDLASIP